MPSSTHRTASHRIGADPPHSAELGRPGRCQQPIERGRAHLQQLLPEGRFNLQVVRWLGFRAMQFNLVVSTNTAGIRCWERNGFHIVGTLPGAFRHKQLGYMDAYVMVQGLVEGPAT